MPPLRKILRNGSFIAGGVAGYPLDQLHQEVAYVAYYFHWPMGEILEMDHRARRRWVQEIAEINRRLSKGA